MNSNTNIHGSDNKVAGRDIHIHQEAIIYKHIENFDKIIKSSKVDYEFLIEICDTHTFFYGIFLDADSNNYSPKEDLFSEFYNFIDHSYEYHKIQIEYDILTIKEDDPLGDGLDHFDTLMSDNISNIITSLGIIDDLLDEYLFSAHSHRTDLVRIVYTFLELINRAVELTPLNRECKHEFLNIKKDLIIKLEELHDIFNKYELKDNRSYGHKI